MNKFPKKLEIAGLFGGVALLHAKKVTEEFLKWWENHIRETEPYALKTISAIENVLMSFPSDEEIEEGIK